MSGDTLAKGGKSAMFGPPRIPSEKIVDFTTPKAKRVVFADCKCGKRTYSAAEFSDHVHEAHAG